MRIRWFALVSALVMTIGCGRQEAKQGTGTAGAATPGAGKPAAHAGDVGAPYDNRPEDVAGRQQQRFDQRWRQLQSFQAQAAASRAQATTQTAPQPAAPAQAQPPAGFTFVSFHKESFKGLTPEAINAAPAGAPIEGDVLGPSILRAQVYLDRTGYSVGSIDGRWGRNSGIAVWWWQQAHQLPATGTLDDATYRSLAAAATYAPVVTRYALTDADLRGPFVHLPDDVYEKAKLQCLCYENVKEEIGERFHVDPDFLDVLNPAITWSGVKSGDSIVVPNVEVAPATQADIARIVVSIAGNSLNGFDAAGRLVFHAPTTVGSGYDPSPAETLHVVSVAPMPHFHYDPTLYHEVPDSDPDAHLPPGPNSPVGVVWMALSKEHYGIHGTSDPESIGYASSHGCIRLTNWSAEQLSHRISRGVEVNFVDLREKDVPPVARKNGK